MFDNSRQRPRIQEPSIYLSDRDDPGRIKAAQEIAKKKKKAIEDVTDKEVKDYAVEHGISYIGSVEEPGLMERITSFFKQR